MEKLTERSFPSTHSVGPYTYIGDLEKIPGSQLWISSVLATSAIWVGWKTFSLLCKISLSKKINYSATVTILTFCYLLGGNGVGVVEVGTAVPTEQ